MTIVEFCWLIIQFALIDEIITWKLDQIKTTMDQVGGRARDLWDRSEGPRRNDLRRFQDIIWGNSDSQKNAIEGARGFLIWIFLEGIQCIIAVR